MKECRLSLGRRQIALKTQFREPSERNIGQGVYRQVPAPLELSVRLGFCLRALLRKPRPVIKGRGMFVC